MTEEKEETKLNIKGQWFYRGNRSPTWVAMASRSDGSASGVAERVPQEVWPILECVASQAAEIENLETGNAILVDMVHRADAEMARLKEEVASLLHRDHQVASMITWLENYQPDVFKRGLWDALPKSPDAVKKPRFEKVYCSQCGGEFGPRDSGYSHCKDHIRDAALAAKSTEQNNQEATVPREGEVG